MKKIYLFVWLLGLTYPFCAKNVDLHIKPVEHAKIPLLLGVIKEDDELHEIAELMKRNFTFHGQFDVSVKLFAKRPTKKQLTQLHKQGHLLAVFVNPTVKNKAFEWRVYDTLNASMVSGKKYTKHGTSLRGWAHGLSDAIWQILTSQEGFFSTKIAYCKEVKLAHGKSIKHVCIADYDGGYEQVIVDLPTVNVAPRWNADIDNPLLFYSTYTNENVRLMTVDMHKKMKTASNFDGINMLPAFTRDGKKVVYCVSRGNGSCQLYYCEQGIFKRLTQNNGTNMSPSLSDDGQQVFFCSDFQTGSPQVYVYDMKTKKLERITNGGYCASPRYSSKRRQVAYTKIVQGTMQLFAYDLDAKTHVQLTFDAGNKQECAWSPCGTYLLVAVEQGVHGRIALLNLITNERRYITPENAVCSYPDWSRAYRVFPEVVVA